MLGPAARFIALLLPPPPVHALRHRVGLAPDQILAHGPAVGLQGEGNPVRHHHEIAWGNARLSWIVAIETMLLGCLTPDARVAILASAAGVTISIVEPKNPIVSKYAPNFSSPFNGPLYVALGSWLEAQRLGALVAGVLAQAPIRRRGDDAVNALVGEGDGGTGGPGGGNGRAAGRGR